MASIFRQQTTRYTLDGKRVPAGTPGATKTVTRSRKWYGEIPDPQGGRPLRVPLSTNRAASIQMLGQLLRDGGDPAAAHRRTPLSVHLDAFLAEIAGAPKGKARRPPSPETVRDTAARLRRVLLGRCGYDYAHQITLEGVQAALAALAEPAGLPELDRDSYGRAEAAALLGVGPETVAVHVRRWRLPQLGAGRGVRYPRETVRDLLGRRRGAAGWGLTGPQREVVRQLLSAQVESSNPDVEEQVLLRRAMASGVRRLSELFSGHPAWGELILPGARPATYRLAPPPDDDGDEAVRVEPEN